MLGSGAITNERPPTGGQTCLRNGASDLGAGHFLPNANRLDARFNVGMFGSIRCRRQVLEVGTLNLDRGSSAFTKTLARRKRAPTGGATIGGELITAITPRGT